MEKSSMEGRDRLLCAAGSLGPYFKAITCSQGLPARLQFIGPEVRDPLTEQHGLANNCNLYLAGRVIDNFVRKGGDEPMGQNS